MATAKENERMYRDVRRYLKFHFDNGRTLEQLQNIGDEQSNPELAGQHQSVRIVRLPIPATEDGLFVIKNLGSGGEYPRNARDLFAEASAMELVGTYTKIPVPKVYYACRADEKDPQLSFIAMEYVKGEAYKKSLRLTRSQRISIIRQMAIIRIEMIKVMSALIGSVEYPMTRIKGNIVDPNFLNPAGEMVGPEVSAEGRKTVQTTKSYNLGPYPTVQAYVLAFLEKEIAFHNLSPQDGSWKDYTEALRKNLREREFAKDTVFRLSHGDLVEGNNVILKNSKIVSIIDWETAGFLPFSEVVADLLPDIEAEFDGDTRPAHQMWIKSMNEKYGRLGGWKAWPLEKGFEALENNYDLNDELDSDIEYEEDEPVAEVGDDWWANEVVRQTWRLIDLWMTANSYDQELWRDPIVFSICRMGISDTKERLIVQERKS